MADLNPHTFYYYGLTTPVREAQEGVRLNTYDPTDVNTSLLTSVSSATDVVVYDDNYTTYCGYSWDNASDNIYGLVTCVSLTSSRCEKHETRYDLSEVNSAMPLANRNAIACHETGHTLGLLHRNVEAGCMNQQGPDAPWAHLTAHDVNHLYVEY